MSRIIAGAAGGTPLVSVPGSLTRPTTDRVKEALFSRLDAFDVMAGARVLDLYAGSGSLGVESASRGARRRGPGGVRRQGQRGLPAQRGPRQRRRWAARRSPCTVPGWSPSWTGPLQGTAVGPRVPGPALPAGRARPGRGAGQAGRRTWRRAPSWWWSGPPGSPEPAWPAGLERFAEKKYGETRLWFAEPAWAAGSWTGRRPRPDACLRAPEPSRRERPGPTPASTFAGCGPRAVSCRGPALRPRTLGAGQDDVAGVAAGEHAGFGEGSHVRHGPPQGRHLAADQRQPRFVAHVDDQHAPRCQPCRGFLVELRCRRCAPAPPARRRCPGSRRRSAVPQAARPGRRGRRRSACAAPFRPAAAAAAARSPAAPAPAPRRTARSPGRVAWM